jgi:hypothetical protein
MTILANARIPAQMEFLVATPGAVRVRVRCDGVDDPRWRTIGDDTIEIESEIGEHRFDAPHAAIKISNQPPSSTAC